VEIPETRYAKAADGVHIAYQVVGDGPIDILFVLGWVTHLERMWTEPRFARFYTRLASFSRVMLFDKRGVGLSDRVSEDRLPSLEVRMDDARAVMDAVGSDRAVVLGVSEGGPMAMLFAATYPERTIALTLFGTSACWNDAPDYPYRETEQEQIDFEAFRERRERLWGTKELAREFLEESFSPPLADDAPTQAWLADYMRYAASPGAVNALSQMNRAIDVRSTLPAIHVPTLVLARDDDRDFSMEETRWLAEQIHGARFISFPGNEHLFVMGRQEDLLDEIERFVAAVRDDEAELDRVLATVMFTDIVGSTEKAAELGDKGWGDLVEQHHGVVRAMLGRFRGTEVDTAGDGFFATFDGPARGVRCAQAITSAVRDLGIEVRAGVHTGEVETIAGKAGGIAVNVGAPDRVDRRSVGGARLPHRARAGVRVRPGVQGRGRARAEGCPRALAPLSGRRSVNQMPWSFRTLSASTPRPIDSASLTERKSRSTNVPSTRSSASRTSRADVGNISGSDDSSHPWNTLAPGTAPRIISSDQSICPHPQGTSSETSR
jgi:pimeloyl-ACP methyl ester carboxylesterase